MTPVTVGPITRAPLPLTFRQQEVAMANRYRSPTIVALGPAQVLTHGLPGGTLCEAPVGHLIRTTHAMLDL
jgi:hypothetical protein